MTAGGYRLYMIVVTGTIDQAEDYGRLLEEWL